MTPKEFLLKYYKDDTITQGKESMWFMEKLLGQFLALQPKPEISLDTLTLKDRDIILAKLGEEYYTPENATHVIEAIKSTLGVVAEEKKIGILIARHPNEIILLDDELLISLGLVKLKKLVEELSDDEMIEFMSKLGFDKTHPFQKAPNPKEIHKKIEPVKVDFIVYTNEENSLEDIAKKYGVTPEECFDSKSDLLKGQDLNDYFHLYPRLDNKWVIPVKKGK